MTDENGNLSIDFLAGFTIFMVAFIWVVTMIPGLMIGLQSYTIDYDAVAYRTGVILVEDPGWPVSPPWESFTDMQKSNVTRFGLALSKDTPNILSQDKVNRFFCETAFIFPDDYRTRVIFGDYPYGFNISLIDLGGQNRSRGDALPDGHGTIRRLIKIKGTSNATIGNAKYTAYPSSYINNDNVTTHVFSILIDNPTLLKMDPVYQIDPAREQIAINITDLKSTIREFPPTITRSSSTIVLQNIKIYKRDGNSYSNIPLPASEYPYLDGSSTRVAAMPYNVSDNVTLKFTPRFFDLMKAQSSQIYIALGFEVTPPSTFLNNTQAVPDFNNLDGALTFTNNSNTTPFNYNYDPNNVTQPYLRDAVVEVAVWSGSATGPTGGGGSIPTTNGSFTIQAIAGPGGLIAPAGSVIVNNGDNQTFSIVPNIGYQVADVLVDGSTVGNITTYTFINVTQDHTIAGSFAIPITGIGNITGTPQVGSLLTAGALTPAGATATYQWQRANTSGGTYSNIAGATATTYTPVAGDGGYYIKVVATGTGSYTNTVTSAYVGPVTIIPTTQSFTANGTSTVPQGAISVDYCVVGGGGGGGRYGGGGGAGGFRTGTITGLSSSYAVTVGGYGLGATGAAQGASGGISEFASIISAGGGGGGSSSGTLAIRTGANGGSGGGGIRATTNGGTGNTPPVAPSQGNDGGAGSTSGGVYYGGGGGGAGGSGIAAIGSVAGNGGAGSICAINGVTYAGGGGGGSNSAGTAGGAGSGGGGAGGDGAAGTIGTANTGGGGGGGGSGPSNGGNGGSGFVIVRYY